MVWYVWAAIVPVLCASLCLHPLISISKHNALYRRSKICNYANFRWCAPVTASAECCHNLVIWIYFQFQCVRFCNKRLFRDWCFHFVAILHIQQVLCLLCLHCKRYEDAPPNCLLIMFCPDSKSPPQTKRSLDTHRPTQTQNTNTNAGIWITW